MKKILIAAGTARYAYLPDHEQRPQLTEVVAKIKAAFSKDMHYELALEHISNNPSSNQLRDELDDWLGDPQRSGDDWVVIYYTGHGEILDSGSLYLWTSNYRSGKHAATAFLFSQLADMVAGRTASGENRRTKRILFILDTCYAGAGANEIMEKIGRYFTHDSRSGMYYVLAASFPNEPALAGGLSDALLASLEELSQKSKQQQYIFFDQINAAINQRLGAYKAYFVNVTSADEVQQFFPNPYCEANSVATPVAATTFTPAELQCLKGININEFRNYWAPNARGVTAEVESGWYFTARTKLLNEIAVWLKDKAADPMLIVTGPAGSGKSTILSAIVLLAQEIAAGLTERYTIDKEDVRQFRRLDLAIHARGKTPDDTLHIIADAIAVKPEMEAVLAQLQTRGDYFMLMDALDEAVDPQRICNQLLKPLSKVSGIRILIGSRPEAVRTLGEDLPMLYIDDAKYISYSDFELYISRRLTGITAYRSTDHLTDDIEYLRAVKKIAGKAYPNFLIGRLATAALEAAGTDIASFNQQLFEFPASVNAAFDLYLRRFNEHYELVRDILRPLAWSHGSGFPWDHIWSALANAFSGKEYHDDDIRWVINNAGSFIVETLEFGRSVFRLYHEAMVEFLKGDMDEVAANRLIVRALVKTVPLLDNRENRDWRMAHPYLLHYLPGHAAIGHDLEWLTNDPLFLLCANDVKLHTVLITNNSQVSPQLLDVYQSAVHHIREKNLAEAAVYLQLSAWKYSLRSFYMHYAWAVINGPWKVIWATWLPPSSSNEIAHGMTHISALTTGKWGEQHVVAVCRSNGTVEIWDMERSAKIFTPDTGMKDGAVAMALAATRSGAVLVMGWSGGQMKTINLDTGEVLSLNTGYKITLLHTAKRNGEDVCIIYYNRSAIAIRALAGLELILKRENMAENALYSIDDVKVGQQHCLLAVGDHLVADTGGTASNILLFSMDDLTTVWSNSPSNRGVFVDVQVQQLFNTTIAVISQDNWGPTEIWDLKRGAKLFRDNQTGTYSWIYPEGNRLYLFTVFMSRLRRLEVQYDKVLRQLSGSDDYTYPDVMLTGKPYRTLQVNGREQLLTVNSNYLHIWDIESVIRSKSATHGYQLLKQHTGGFAVRLQRSPVLYVGTRTGVAILHAETSEWKEDYEMDGNDPVALLSIAPDESMMAVVRDSGNVYLCAVYADTGTLSAGVQLFTADAIGALYWIKRDGRYILMAAVRERGVWLVRLWNITPGGNRTHVGQIRPDAGSDAGVAAGPGVKRIRGEEMPTNSRIRLYAGQEDKMIEGLTAKVINDKLRIAFASKYGMVNILDYEDLQDSVFAIHEWYTPSNTGEYIECLLSCNADGRDLLIAAAEYGQITIFDFKTGEVITAKGNAHETKVTALCVFSSDKGSCFISGDDRGVLKFWSFRLQERYSIDLRAGILKLEQGGDGRLYVYTRSGMALLQLSPDLYETIF
ncbi:caspase family protein [Chitinophaga agri]|uniref:Peptidase C14 caspase domain-containing protein n=1 Tax=Chitinophaga agri TaxID=2703787 RepID=A0A6B9ZQ62_9BACT|nr:caspase family protein [Chitinophaga agri]QHS63445.1 hypothetical protein GWR21_28825 [Chitinophaga agri]